MKRAAVRSYFDKRCNDVDVNGAKCKMFWDAMKPYLSSNQNKDHENIALLEKDSVVNDQETVSNILNDHFVNVASDMCEFIRANDLSVDGIVAHYSDHPSVTKILSQLASNSGMCPFSFQSVNSHEVLLKIKSLNSRKACGFDLIPAKLIKQGANVICRTLTPIVNDSLYSATFPKLLKYAEVSPIFKKDDPLIKSNYRPVSVLNSVSKIFESILCDQLNYHFKTLFNNALAAYRRKYSCENVLLKCVEDWKRCLDEGQSIGCLMIDLSKAFDCLPHGLLTAKLHAYGLDRNACKLILSYLSDRGQRVKLGSHRSAWKTLDRGVPQGSLLGPLLFNVFLNDYFAFLDCQVYNYADDITLCSQSNDLTCIKHQLEKAANESLKWFSCNFMKANPSKFQSMIISRQSNCSLEINVDGSTVASSECVKLLGVFIDNRLSFSNHVSQLCKKVGKQINAMCRLSRHLSEKSLMKVYNALILANLNYATTVWHLCGVNNTKKLDKLQERALRIIFKDYEMSYPELLTECDMSTLYVQRLRKIVIMVHKIIHDNAKPFPNDFFKFKPVLYDFRSQNMLDKVSCNTSKYGINSFLFQGATLWNSLSNEARFCENVLDLKSYLVKWNGPECSCGSCLLCNGF
jgi:hypothetical protein